MTLHNLCSEESLLRDDLSHENANCTIILCNILRLHGKASHSPLRWHRVNQRITKSTLECITFIYSRSPLAFLHTEVMKRHQKLIASVCGLSGSKRLCTPSFSQNHNYATTNRIITASQLLVTSICTNAD